MCVCEREREREKEREREREREVDEVSKEIGRYEFVTGVKINRAVGFVEGLCSSRPLHLKRRSVQDTWRLVRSRSPTGEKLVGSTGKVRSRD